MCFLFCSYQKKPRFLYLPLPLYHAGMTSVALPPVLGLSVHCLSVSALPSALVSGLEWDQGQGALGSLRSLHFYKAQMKELWCGIQQSLSSDHTHSHGLHRPSSGPVPLLQTPLMTLQMLWETAPVSGTLIYFARPVLHPPKLRQQ